jgi:hypothetical protein
MTDIVERLRNWFREVNAVSAIDLMDEAANEIERLRLRWVPVSEQLPEDGQTVIVCFEGRGVNGQVGEATFNKRGGWFSTELGAWGASHWMPLPGPPELK